jgi:hypothetical protein
MQVLRTWETVLRMKYYGPLSCDFIGDIDDT